MNTNHNNQKAVHTQSAFFNFFALAILSVLLLVFAKHAGDIVPASDKHPIMALTYDDDLLSDDLAPIDMVDVCDYLDISGRPDDESTTANGVVKHAPAQLDTGHKDQTARPMQR